MYDIVIETSGEPIAELQGVSIPSEILGDIRDKRKAVCIIGEVPYHIATDESERDSGKPPDFSSKCMGAYIPAEKRFDLYYNNMR